MASYAIQAQLRLMRRHNHKQQVISGLFTDVVTQALMISEDYWKD